MTSATIKATPAAAASLAATALSGRVLLAIAAGLAGLVALLGDAMTGESWGHLAVCLPGGAAVADTARLTLFGHCAWCYAAVGLAAAAVVAPGRRRR